MANQDPEKDNLFKEIDEEIRQENYIKLWRKYGKYLIGVVTLFVFSVASYKWWEQYDLSKRERNSILYADALKAKEQNNASDALSAFNSLAKNRSKGYSALARLNQASLIAHSGDSQSAALAYLEIAHDVSVSQEFRNLAFILSAIHDIESGDLDQIAQRIKPLVESTNPWRHSAKELMALIASRKGNNQRANLLFKELADDVTTPVGIRSRAAEMSAVTGS